MNFLHFLQWLCSFFRRREVQPQPSATLPVLNMTSPLSSVGERQIGIFNGAHAVTIHGGTFIIVVSGERFLPFKYQQDNKAKHMQDLLPFRNIAAQMII